MSQRREIEAHLALYDDLSGILGAMRSFALAELHRVSRQEQAQQQIVDAVRAALEVVALSRDDASFEPPRAGGALTEAWLLFGSVRGFCGSFNEEVIEAWQAAGAEDQPVIVVGERLAATMPTHAALFPVAGADGSLDAFAAIDRILIAFADVRCRHGQDCGLVACLRDENGARIVRLLPLLPPPGRSGTPPLLNEAPAVVAARIAEHYLFHQLLALVLRSIWMENRLRLMQMESALRHIEEGTGDLARQRNRLRQEEIVEEIEVIAGRRK